MASRFTDENQWEISLLFMFEVCIFAKRLFFRCATSELNQSCPHNFNERLLRGTWPTAELRLALKYGYSIIAVDEVFPLFVS